MFDKLLELLGNFWDNLKPFEILHQYEQGVHLRKGNLLRLIGPGLVWKFPIWDEFLTDTTVPTTTLLRTQTLTTADGFTVVVRGVVTRKITNIEKFLLEAEDGEGVIVDSCYAAIGEVVLQSTWEEIHTEDFVRAITKKARLRARKYGVNIIELRPADLVKLKAYRLIGEK